MNTSTEHIPQCNQAKPLADASGRIWWMRMYLYMNNWWTELDFQSFQYARLERMNKGWGGQERSRRWLAFLVLHLHPGSVGRRFDLVSFIKSYSTAPATCTCIIISQIWPHLVMLSMSSAPYFCILEKRSKRVKKGRRALKSLKYHLK